MPELPDITIYIEALRDRIAGRRLTEIRIATPFLLRSVDPPISAVAQKTVKGVRRIGKQIVVELEEDLYLILHLMIAGRLHWKKPGTRPAGRTNLAAFDFENGALLLTEAGSKKRTSLRVVRGEESLEKFRRGGIEVMDCTLTEFCEALTRENHTLKRALTDPRLFSGIGNAYSDEILLAAHLSPLKLSQKMSAREIRHLYDSARAILRTWIDRLRAEADGEFPEKVTAFRPGMAVHGRFGKPCSVCGSPVQRIVYAENEANYCAVCQTDGKLLADRALSRLLHGDWPKTIEELEGLKLRGSRVGDREEAVEPPVRDFLSD